MKFKSLYVAATNQHVGKTTSTLGLVSAFMKKGYSVGYCKPVGQKFLDVKNLRVDKDTILFADLIHFDLIPDIHSPVILGPGATSKYLENPESYPHESKIISANKKLTDQNDLVIFEGTGHPGVGSVANLSNAYVAKMVNASVIMVVEGGIGSTIDKMNMTLALFREQNVPILGVIVNKVIPEKMSKIRHYLKKWMDQHDLPLLGLVPYDKSLAYPLMRNVTSSINGIVTHNAEKLDNKVEDILAGSLIDLKELSTFKNLLLVVGARIIDTALKKIDTISKMINIQHSPLSGIVATGQGTPSQQSLDYIHQHQIPLVRTNLDTYGSVLKISKIEVKINQNTPWKVKRAIELIGENVDLNHILIPG